MSNLPKFTQLVFGQNQDQSSGPSVSKTLVRPTEPHGLCWYRDGHCAAWDPQSRMGVVMV
jgi:hypothetical protein